MDEAVRAQVVGLAVVSAGAAAEVVAGVAVLEVSAAAETSAVAAPAEAGDH